MTSRRHQRNASPRFRSIQAVFEQQGGTSDLPPPPRPFSRGSKPKTPTDEPPNPASNLISRETIQTQRETIDALLEASSDHRWPTSREPLRPKSSWIGPPPPPSASRLPSHDSTAAMPRKVTVTYASPGLQPPVYITTSLSEPQWELLEMDCSESSSGERTFFKTFQAAEGEYQYKFRLGPGDWWACDEAMPTVDDGFGNRNNVLEVKGDVPARTSAANQPQTDEGSDSELGLLSPGPAFAHERDVAHHKEKRDSLGDDVLGKSPLGEMDQTEHGRDHDHNAPLFAHEQNGSPYPKLVVPPEDVPVTFTRQDTQTSDDDDDGDVEPAHFPGSPLFAHERDVDEEPSHFPESPLFAHERDVEPLRIHTPGADEDEDHMEDPPLMRHETLSPTSSRQDNPFPHNQNHDGYDSDVLVSPVSSHASLQLSLPEDHAPAEADPNDPSLEQFPTHHEGILSSLRRASMRMTEDQTAAEVHATTSPVSKTKSHSSSLSPSLPSVLEDEEEEPEEDSSKAPEQHAHTANAKIGVAAGAMAGLTMLSETHERPAALMTPPRTPDESKAPHGVAPPASDHHHKPAAEKDMLEEATHDVSHHESAPEKDQIQAGGPGGNKSPWDGFFQTAMGLGLTVLVGAGAVWLAFRMQDSIKDGGAVLKR